MAGALMAVAIWMLVASSPSAESQTAEGGAWVRTTATVLASSGSSGRCSYQVSYDTDVSTMRTGLTARTDVQCVPEGGGLEVMYEQEKPASVSVVTAD